MLEPDLDAILAIDLGLRTGVAVWQRDGTLRTWQAIRFPTRTALRSGVRTIVRDVGEITTLVTEGDRALAKWWQRAVGPEVEHVHVQARHWRADLFPGRRFQGREAKRAAEDLARTLIDRHAQRGAPHLRHDAAEAICLGFWAGMRAGW